jgi:hypothetical protein
MTPSTWTWAAASCRGTSHERGNVRRQDAFKCLVTDAPGHPIAIVVSDGAGTAPFGGPGAALVCKTIAALARRHFSTFECLPDPDTLESWVDAARERIAIVAERRELLPRDFAATLVLVVSNASETVVLHVGDGCAVVRDVSRGIWAAATWPDHGEYASTTSFITDGPGAHIRVSRCQSSISALAVFSDGLERLVLDFRSGEPSSHFFDSMIAPVEQSERQCKDPALSQQLLAYLKSDRVSSRTDDDKTLILAVRR